MQRETELQNQIRVAVSKGLQRLWRNNVGVAHYRYRGKHRKVRFGLCEGSSDLIGYKSMTVQPWMVGQKLAVFVALEVKTPLGQPTTAQTRFLDHVLEAGGIAGLVRSVEDAELLLQIKLGGE